MDRRTENIISGFKELVKQDALIMAASVIFVDEANEICSVTFGGVIIENVRLRSAADGTPGFVLIPSVGANVTIAQGEGQSDYFLIGANQVDKIKAQVGTTSVIINSTGVQVTKGTESLKSILEDLLTAILEMVFTTNVGPTITLVNAPSFENIQTRINNLLI